jgi:uncharacterized protein
MIGGLSDRTIDFTIEALKLFPEIEKAALYGSRAKGAHKKGSDIDIAVYGKNINTQILLEIKVHLNERTPMPYFFDVTNYEKVKAEELKKEIHNYGIPFYYKQDT